MDRRHSDPRLPFLGTLRGWGWGFKVKRDFQKVLLDMKMTLKFRKKKYRLKRHLDVTGGTKKS